MSHLGFFIVTFYLRETNGEKNLRAKGKGRGYDKKQTIVILPNKKIRKGSGIKIYSLYQENKRKKQCDTQSFTGFAKFSLQ